MSPIVEAHLAATFFREYLALRDQLLAVLTDADLELELGGGTVTLGTLCREIGEIERAYVDSFRTFVQTFDYQHPDSTIAGSVAALTAWFAGLDRDLFAALDAITDEDAAHRRIVRSDFTPEFFSPLVAEQCDTYREALLIFYGKASIYLRAMGKPLPGDWASWIG